MGTPLSNNTVQANLVVGEMETVATVAVAAGHSRSVSDHNPGENPNVTFTISVDALMLINAVLYITLG